MQLCESCGACRETDWRLCPFCGEALAITDASETSDNERFDALAAVGETSSLDVLPSLMAEDEDEDADENLITAQDLAHLTGDGGPSANGWDSASPVAPAAPEEANEGIDAPVSKLVVVPMVAVALAAVAFVAYSILTASPTIRPDAVALIDQTTTTISPITTTEPPVDQPGVVGVDLAEQASWLCSGDQFSIARANAPSLAIYNDILTSTRDGSSSWSTPEDHVTLQSTVPPLIGCLATSDGGEIDRCPGDGPAISRRSVVWTYRLLQSNNGELLGSDEGTATDLRSCEELRVEANGRELATWSPLPLDRFAQVAPAYATAPHPSVACVPDQGAPDVEPTEQTIVEGLSAHAAFASAPGADVSLPAGWEATDERPVEVVLCLEHLVDETEDPDSPSGDTPTADGSTADSSTENIPTKDDTVADALEDVPTAPACEGTIRVTAMLRDGQDIGSWDYPTTVCPTADLAQAIPNDWWLDVVGPELGYSVEPEESSEGE